ncbi:MAG: hypothetical protein HRT35_37500, partial [Algicola sp.]|nr:hypothetical protein [Algicola sp.]
LRDVDHRAFVYAHGSKDYRLTFFLDKIKDQSLPSNKDPQNSVAKITAETFAYVASTSIEQATEFLDKLQLEGKLKHTDKSITFYGQHT